MEDELVLTIAAYQSLIEQSAKLADIMMLKQEYVLGVIMPKTAKDRTDTSRITEWFNGKKHRSVQWLMERDKEIKKDAERKHLLSSLNLTPEQINLLGLTV